MKEILEYLYSEGRLSTYQIAGQFGVSNVTIWNMLNEFNIPTRTLSESRMGEGNPMYGSNQSGKNNGNYRHGGAGTRLWNIYSGIKSRCYNLNDTAYKYYGKKNVTMCPEWLNDFCTFRDWSIVHGYTNDSAIHRKNSGGNYDLMNCQWLTESEHRKTVFE